MSPQRAQSSIVGNWLKVDRIQSEGTSYNLKVQLTKRSRSSNGTLREGSG